MTSETVQRRSKRVKKMKCISVLTIQSKTKPKIVLSFDPELYLVRILEVEMQIVRESVSSVKSTIAKELPYLIVIEEHEVSLLWFQPNSNKTY